MADTNNVLGVDTVALGLYGVVFVTLKLTHVINWSWWWVTAPFWVGFAVFVVLLVPIFLYVRWREK